MLLCLDVEKDRLQASFDLINAYRVWALAASLITSFHFFALSRAVWTVCGSVVVDMRKTMSFQKPGFSVSTMTTVHKCLDAKAGPLPSADPTAKAA